MVDVMRKRTKSRFILIGIVILALILCLWVIFLEPRDDSSNAVSLAPQTISDDGARDSDPVRNRNAERAHVRLQGSRSAVPDESVPNQGRPPQSIGSEKRRAVQSTIAGIVANSQDGAPIQGARLKLSPVGSEDVRSEAVSGHDGSFRMTIRDAGRYTLRAQADGFRPHSTDGILITPAERSLQKNILMTPRLELRGRVVDRHSRGIAGAQVRLREETPGRFGRFKSCCGEQSDESGRFLVPRPPVSGTFFAEAAHPEYELDSRVPVTLPKDDEVVITMRRVPEPLLASISGHVWDAKGHPIHGASVGLIEREQDSHVSNYLGDTSTDPMGRFFFPRVRWGTYSISADAEGYAVPSPGQGRKDLIVESSQEYEIDLVLERQTAVQGVVVDTEGRPVTKAGVNAVFELGTGRTFIGVFTPSDGTFNIPEVPPGRLWMQVTHRDYVTYEAVLVTPTDEFLTVTLQPGFSLTGYVMDQNNEPIREFSLRLSPASRQHDVPASPFDSKTADVSPSDGHFRVNGLAPQTYILSLRPPNAESLETRLELSESTSVTIVHDPSDSDAPIQVRKSW